MSDPRRGGAGAALSLSILLLAGTAMDLSAAPGAPLGDPAHLESGLSARPGILFYEGFATDAWVRDFNPEWGPSPAEHCSLAADADAPGGRALRILYPSGLIGGDSACQFLCRFPRMGLPAMEEAWLRYYVKFDKGFNFVRGGKLPGLGGGTANTGGHPANGKDGWTARIMWRPGGRIVQYVYHPGQKTIYGDDLDWEVDGEHPSFQPGQWACVETRVRMNTPGEDNGEIQSWLDGREALHATGLRFRDVPGLKIDVFYFSTFFGGGDPSWAATKDEHAEFTGFVIGRGPIGPAAGFPGGPYESVRNQ